MVWMMEPRTQDHRGKERKAWSDGRGKGSEMERRIRGRCFRPRAEGEGAGEAQIKVNDDFGFPGTILQKWCKVCWRGILSQ